MIVDYKDAMNMKEQIAVPADALKTTEEVMHLFTQWGDAGYDGEPVTQTSHMVQCAMLAMEANADPELVLGAFLHDVGHLLGHKQQGEDMGGFGAVNHEGIGAMYLRQKGFSERICAVVNGHVAAKRYLVATDEAYAATLSAASRETLRWQGGPMTVAEVTAFEKHPFFADIIQVRLWDEKAKDANAVLLPMHVFKSFMIDYLSNRC